MKTETAAKNTESTKSSSKISASKSDDKNVEQKRSASKLLSQQPPAATPVSCQQISERAYELWLKRGCIHGFHVEDWLEAEAQLQKEIVA